MTMAQRENATPCDVPDVEFGHHDQECSFEGILKKYQPTNDWAPVLLGKSVNGAETDNALWRLPEGAALAEGFSHPPS